MEWDEQTLLPKHSSSSPKLKSLQDLSIRIDAKVVEETIDYVGMWVDGGLQLRILLQCVLDPSDPLQKFHYKTVTLNPIASGLCRIATRLCSPVLWRHEGWRPRQVEWHVPRVWWGISARWTRREHTLHFPKMPSSSCNNTHNNKAQTQGPSTLGVCVKC
jgi:hypothetical protein